MTPAGRPPPVVRYLRRPLWWALGILAFVAVELGAQAREVLADGSSFRDAVVVVASVPADVQTGTIDLTYRDPTSGEPLRAAVLANHYVDRQPDGGLEIDVSRSQPNVVRLVTERRGFLDDTPFLFALLAAPLILWAARLVHVRRLESLMQSDEPSYQLLAAPVAPTWLHRRWRVCLYPTDARAGAAPLSSVELIWLPALPNGAFTVEAKGSPRPFGRVALLAGDDVLWPRGPTLSIRVRKARPSHVVELPPPTPALATPIDGPERPPSLWLSRLMRIAGIACLLTMVIIGDDRQWHAQEQLEHSRPAVGTVVTSGGDFASERFATIRYSVDGTTLTARTSVEGSIAEAGAEVPIRYAADNPNRAWISSDRGPPDQVGDTVQMIAFFSAIALLVGSYSRRRAELALLGAYELRTTGRVSLGTLPRG